MDKEKMEQPKCNTTNFGGWSFIYLRLKLRNLAIDAESSNAVEEFRDKILNGGLPFHRTTLI